MTHDTRRWIRVISGILNIVIQLLMLWIIVRNLDNRSVQTVEQILIIIKSILTNMSIMLGTFFTYYALIRLIDKRNLRSSRSSG